MFHSMKPLYRAQVAEEFRRQPAGTPELLTIDDMSRLPATIQRYLGFCKAIGKPKVRNFRVCFEVEMLKKPGARVMKASSEQHNFEKMPARLFYMKTSVFGIPADGLHSYRDAKATMTVRVASLFNVVDASGPVLDQTETVTLLNDYCVLAPAVLIEPRFAFETIDEHQTKVVFQNEQHRVSAVLQFGNNGELVNFLSEDRSELQDDGTFRKLRFSTPVGPYREIADRRVPSYGEAAFHRPEGLFTYGKFWLRGIEYNLDSAG